MIPNTCCDMFSKAVMSDIVACVSEDEWNRKLTRLDGWYLMKRSYDSWYGNNHVGLKWKVCPWCAGSLPPLYIKKNEEDKLKQQECNHVFEKKSRNGWNGHFCVACGALDYNRPYAMESYTLDLTENFKGNNRFD